MSTTSIIAVRKCKHDPKKYKEDKLASRRSDVTIPSTNLRIVLEPKNKKNGSVPTDNEWQEYHIQLRGYLESRRKEDPTQVVAGVVPVMHNRGKDYSVQSHFGSFFALIQLQAFLAAKTICEQQVHNKFHFWCVRNVDSGVLDLLRQRIIHLT
jgi:hypothetical protein